ncbi:AraC family transcriptional regulator [Sphingomonas azotifigens]|uniref:AraC family transcriptional regulator n=1 Tax=Sphingomonas azotifigens TaxID=330920 RepID=UPI000A015AEB|nr:AraC family transcriptional regulator [Sphingomonas azotifigens]
MQEQLCPLRDLVARHARGDRTESAIAGLTLLRATEPSPAASGVLEPRLCIVLQGAKQVTINGETYRYDPASYFVASVAVPASGCVSDASADAPYLAVSVAVDRAAIGALLDELPDQLPASPRGFAVNTVTAPLLGALRGLLELLDMPQDIPVLGQARHRELLYRLLQNDDGQLRQIAREVSRLSRIHRAIGWLRAHYDETIRIDELADLAGMSRASFHRHFKAATSMSPLQFQKTLRLQEARRLLRDTGSAQMSAHRVGYESASQFSRDYARLFGLPPARDAARLRARPAEQIDA